MWKRRLKTVPLTGGYSGLFRDFPAKILRVRKENVRRRRISGVEKRIMMVLRMSILIEIFYEKNTAKREVV